MNSGTKISESFCVVIRCIIFCSLQFDRMSFQDNISMTCLLELDHLQTMNHGTGPVKVTVLGDLVYWSADRTDGVSYPSHLNIYHSDFEVLQFRYFVPGMYSV